MSLPKKLATGGAMGALALATPFIAQWEGLRTNAYYDVVGIPTICYGSTSGVKITDKKTKAECDALLNDEIREYMNAVELYVKVPLPDTRKAALTAFSYNVGIGAFKKSTLLKKLNAGDTRGACNELLRWNTAGGIPIKGLTRRREQERNLCLQGL